MFKQLLLLFISASIAGSFVFANEDCTVEPFRNAAHQAMGQVVDDFMNFDGVMSVNVQNCDKTWFAKALGLNFETDPARKLDEPIRCGIVVGFEDAKVQKRFVKWAAAYVTFEGAVPTFMSERNFHKVPLCGEITGDVNPEDAFKPIESITP